MTILVGVLARDGAVIAADRALTFGPDVRLHTIADRIQKVQVLGGRMIVAGTGQLGMSQRFAKSASDFSQYLADSGYSGSQKQAALKQVLANQNEHSTARVVASILHLSGQTNDHIQIGVMMSRLMNADLTAAGANKGQFGALAAYVVNDTPHLCEFQVADFQPEQKSDECWYTSMGSGQILADPYLAFMRRTFWRGGQPNVEDAVFTAMWVIYHAIEAAPGLIAHPIDLAVMKKWDGKKYTARMLTDAERDEHLDVVKASDEHLVAFRQSPPQPIPPPPQPPPPTQ